MPIVLPLGLVYLKPPAFYSLKSSYVYVWLKPVPLLKVSARLSPVNDALGTFPTNNIGLLSGTAHMASYALCRSEGGNLKGDERPRGHCHRYAIATLAGSNS